MNCEAMAASRRLVSEDGEDVLDDILDAVGAIVDLCLISFTLHR